MENLTAAQLKGELRARGLSVKGNKQCLLQRLITAVNSETDAKNVNACSIEQASHVPVTEQPEVAPGLSESEPENPISQLGGQQQSAHAMRPQDVEVSPHDSVSQVTCASRSSQSSSRVESEIRKEDAKRAGLLAKFKVLEKKQQLEDSYLRDQFERHEAEVREQRERREAEVREQLERQIQENRYKQEKEKLELEAEIAEAEARKQIFESYETRSKVSSTSSVVEKPKALNAQDTAFIPRQPIMKSGQMGNAGKHTLYPSPQLMSSSPWKPNLPSKVTPPSAYAYPPDVGLMNSLLSSNVQHSIPRTEMEKFDGDVTKYHSFIKLFDTTIGSKLTDDGEKLAYLERLTKGEANRVVRLCVTLPTNEGYKEARKMLDELYGDMDEITHAYVNEIVNWPNLKSGNAKEFRSFRIMLKACHHALKAGNLEAKDLENPKTMKRVVSKLPYLMQDKWQTLAYDIKQTRKVELGDLVTFVERQESIMKYASIGEESSSKRVAQPERTSKTPISFSHKSKVYNTVVEESTQQQVKCDYCEKDHNIANCESLRVKPFAERSKFVLDKGLCFSCLHKGHMAKDCKRRNTCSICKRKHPTVLHKEGMTDTKSAQRNASTDHKETEQQQNRPVKTNVGKLMNTQGGSDKLSVIPVKVRDKDGNFIPTYAFIDNGSTGTFCTRELLSKLTHQSIQPAQISITTLQSDNVKVDSHVVIGIEICDPDENNSVCLPPTYTLEKIPVSKEDIVKQKDLVRWPHLHSVDIPEYDADIGLLLGQNVPQAMEPIEVIPSSGDGEPFALKTKLGWVVYGPTGNNKPAHVKVNRVKIEDVTLDNLLINMYNQEFKDVNSLDRGPSEEDRQWIAKVKGSCQKINTGHYEIGMPFKKTDPMLPNNRKAVVKRLEGMKKRLMNDDRFYRDYCTFMSDMIEKGYAEMVPEVELHDKIVWYIPHHGVYHHQKTDQIRVVFDCAAKFKGVSLNDALLQGPDLTNPLVEVLLRFRQSPYAFMADIKSMFLQVSVPQKDRDYLRFLWWPDGNLQQDPAEYRMTVHLFGANSSPSCANFALQRTARDNSKDYSDATLQTVLKNFYVDDCLTSAETEEELVKVAHEVKSMCAKGGFELKKFVSNSIKLLQSLPVEQRRKNVKELDLCRDSLPVEKALGINWNIEKDVFTVSVIDKERPLTKRGLLSTIGAMYDPLGIVSPFMLKGRLIMQDLCRMNLGWDELIPTVHKEEWENWKESLRELSGISLDRCVKPANFGTVVSSQIHYFSDASEKGYGSVAYLRLSNREGKVHCTFLFGKSHVAPLKAVTIPRLELMAAVSAVKANSMIVKTLDIPVQRIVFWTDSTTVLRYIRNEKSRFHTFVANRLAMIHDGSKVRQWRYVNSDLNPADDASRGIQSERWLMGPEFLYKDEAEWPEEPLVMGEENLEVKEFVGAVRATDCTLANDPIRRFLQYYSSWHKLKKAVAWLMRVKTALLKKDNVKFSKFLTVKELDEAEKAVLKIVQEEYFSNEKTALSNGERIKKSSPLCKLHPILNEGILRVGGRLSEFTLSFDSKHPVILPGKHNVTQLIIKECHKNVGHQGREHVLSSLRQKYWIIKGNTTVRKVIRDCIKCRRYQAPVVQQLMANLPGDTVYPCEPPFTSVGVDCFGPFYTKRGRSQVKRYGVIFTCLTIHAIHIEVAESLTTDSFINALRRFMSRRGQVQSIRCDRGTNFVGAERELREAMKAWNQAAISETLLQKNIDWIFNTPHASHHGGVWERQIRTVRKVLNAVTKEQVLTDEGLSTLMCEVEAIINSRPLTNCSSDHLDLEPLTPNHLLIMRSSPLVVGKMDQTDMYCRKRWKQVQYLADVFWKRWLHEYLLTLQERQKWHVTSKNLQVGDVVLMMEENSPRCHWPLGRVDAVKMGRDGLVRSVTVKRGKSVFDRPLSKLVLLCRSDNDCIKEGCSSVRANI